MDQNLTVCCQNLADLYTYLMGLPLYRANINDSTQANWEGLCHGQDNWLLAFHCGGEGLTPGQSMCDL